MELIIKTTGYCNFACTFCSAAKTNIDRKKYTRVPDKIVDLIKETHPSSIIAVGGDPLMVEPEYYYHMHSIDDSFISMTTNLKSFYNDPNKWTPLLREDWIGVTTSFQYGNGRRWDTNTVYTEEMFVDVYNKYKLYVGKDLPFIAVIDDDNEDTVIETCKLAKRLGTQVKINNVLAQGLQDTTYPRYKIFKKYIEIIESGYMEYESYCLSHRTSQCPFNTNFTCETSIRSCYIDDNGELRYMQCDHMKEEILLDYKNDNLEISSVYPPFNEHVNENCWMCDLFELCNGCRSQKLHYPPEHCEEMKKILPKLIEIGWVQPKGLL